MSEKIVALVTGGSRGIGAAICKTLARDGFHVVINYSTNEGKAREVLDAITSQKGSGEILGFDISNPKEVEDKIGQIGKKHGTNFRVLVNNAGIVRDALLLRMKSEDLDAVLNTNLKGAIFCTQAASKWLMKARQGSIIQISSVVGEMGNPGQAAYSAAKSGLIGFSKTVAKELASRKIRCNVVTPGYIVTDMTEGLTPEQKEAILRTIPLGDLGTPEDVAELVAFLASEKSRYLTGQVLGINGGMYI